MKKSLVNWIYGDDETRELSLSAFGLEEKLKEKPVSLVEPCPMDPHLRTIGLDWEKRFSFLPAHTMIGLKRLDNIQYCVEDVLKNNIPGDLMETGVWRGGATIFMRALLKAHAVKDRVVWVADSFEGCPAPDLERYPQDPDVDLRSYKDLAVPLEKVKLNFERYGLLDEQVRFLKGWFKDTLPEAPIQKLAVLRLDGDLYASTMDALVNLYPRLSAGGYLIVDDFGTFPSCRQAVLDYRGSHGIQDEIIAIDQTGVYWKRSSGKLSQ
jgi:hypothetical protein